MGGERIEYILIGFSQFNYTTICHLSQKEFNKSAMLMIQQMIAEEPPQTLNLNQRLFGDRAQVREMLQTERTCDCDCMPCVSLISLIFFLLRFIPRYRSAASSRHEDGLGGARSHSAAVRRSGAGDQRSHCEQIAGRTAPGDGANGFVQILAALLHRVLQAIVGVGRTAPGVAVFAGS